MQGIKDLYLRTRSQQVLKPTTVKTPTPATYPSPLRSRGDWSREIESTTKIIPTTTSYNTFKEQTEGQITNPHAKACLTSRNGTYLEESKIVATDCREEGVLNVVFERGLIKVKEAKHLCLTKDKDKLLVKKCETKFSTLQTWKLQNNSLRHSDGSCLKYSVQAINE